MGAFRSFYWGFLLTMLDFRINGFDILPDILGFIFFAIGINALLAESEHFQQAQKFNLVMILLSIFSFYEPQAEPGFRSYLFVILISIVSIIATWFLVYHLFMGISEMATYAGQADLAEEAERRWEQYRLLLIATLVTLFLVIMPPLAVLAILGLLFANIILVIRILGFLKQCTERL